MPFVMFLLAFVLLAGPVQAGEIHFLGGVGVTNHPIETTGAWQVRYMEGLGEHFAYSMSYVNQGHFTSHHRDGMAANLWVRTNEYNRQLSLALGVGPMFYFDTVRPPGVPAQDVHGWATAVNVLASWYAENRLIYQLQGSWVRAGNSFDTLSLLAGIGYQLDAPPSPGPSLGPHPQTERTTHNELTLLGGKTVVNIPGNGSSIAGGIEYRRGLWRFVEWTVGTLYEGKSDLIDRYGVTTQLWLARPFFDDLLALGAGLGFYLAEDRLRAGRSGFFFSEIISITASYRLAERWHLRGTWDRVVTNYDRDSDIFLGGIGYRF